MFYQPSARPGFVCQILMGLSRTVILFIVASGLSLILGVLRIPNIAHGSLYMIGAFMAYTVSRLFGGGVAGYWMAILIAPLAVAFLSFILERGIFCRVYDREHIMLFLLTFAFVLIFGDLVKMVWGAEYRTVPIPPFFQGAIPILGMPFPIYNFFLLLVGPLVAILLYLLVDKTKMGKISRAAAVDREMVGWGRDQCESRLLQRLRHRLFPCRTGRSACCAHRQCLAGHGSHIDHGSLPDRNYRRTGQCLGCAFGRADIRPHRSPWGFSYGLSLALSSRTQR